MKREFKVFTVLAASAAVAGAMVIWVGLAPISASAGHWPVTSWLLHTAMRQAVQTRALGIRAPALQDPALVLRGAGHFARGCAVCHGAPGGRQPVTAAHMTPRPPELPSRIAKWEPRELFWIVKHGVKFTGMPAWPAQQRDDEVWAVVAFLLQLPELTPARYRHLAYGDMAAGAPTRGEAGARMAQLDAPLRETLADCARCHGVDGLGRGRGAFPILAFQNRVYLYETLRAFANGTRFSGIMQPIAAGLSDQDMRDLAAYFNRGPQQQPSVMGEQDAQAVARGKEIAEQGVPQQSVASCTDCHGPAPWRRNPAYPLLAGQYSAYLIGQLQLFNRDLRGGTGQAHIMDRSVHRLSPQQMRDVAAYYTSLPLTAAHTAAR